MQDSSPRRVWIADLRLASLLALHSECRWHSRPPRWQNLGIGAQRPRANARCAAYHNLAGPRRATSPAHTSCVFGHASRFALPDRAPAFGLAGARARARVYTRPAFGAFGGPTTACVAFCRHGAASGYRALRGSRGPLACGVSYARDAPAHGACQNNTTPRPFGTCTPPLRAWVLEPRRRSTSSLRICSVTALPPAHLIIATAEHPAGAALRTRATRLRFHWHARPPSPPLHTPLHHAPCTTPLVARAQRQRRTKP